MIRIRIQLSTLLGRARMTQAQLARITEIRPNTINDLYWEMTERVSLVHLAKICEALDCRLDELLTIEEHRETK